MRTWSAVKTSMSTTVAESVDVEWALRFYNQLNETRHSRLSFYTFNLGSPAGEGNGSYMEYGVSKNDETPIDLGQWLFVVGEAEPWISPTDLSTGCALWKQGVAAKRETADKYGDFHVHPQHGQGQVHGTRFRLALTPTQTPLRSRLGRAG
jgi:hypothetical protein